MELYQNDFNSQEFTQNSPFVNLKESYLELVDNSLSFYL